MGRGKKAQTRNAHKQAGAGGRGYTPTTTDGAPLNNKGQPIQGGQRQKLTAKQQKNLERKTRLQMRKDRQRCAYGDAQWKDDWNKFLLQLKAIGLTIKDVAGDGNCLFRAIADQMEGDPSLHFSYRTKICDYIEENREDYEPFVEDDEPFDKYIKRMRTATTWGGQMEIQAFSMLYQVNVTIHQLDSPRWDIKNFGEGVKTIHLSYHDGQHYCSVRRLDDPNINKRGNPPNIEINSPKISNKQSPAPTNSKQPKKPQTSNQTPTATVTRGITPEEAEVMEVTGCKNREYVRNLLIDNWGDSCAVIEFILMMGPDAKHFEEEYMMEKIKAEQDKEKERIEREKKAKEEELRKKQQQQSQRPSTGNSSSNSNRPSAGNSNSFYGGDFDYDYDYNSEDEYYGDYTHLGGTAELGDHVVYDEADYYDDYNYDEFVYDDNNNSKANTNTNTNTKKSNTNTNSNTNTSTNTNANANSNTNKQTPTHTNNEEDYFGYRYLDYGAQANTTSTQTSTPQATNNKQTKPEKEKKNYQKPKKNQPAQDPEVPFIHPKLAKFANQNLSNKERKELTKTQPEINQQTPTTKHQQQQDNDDDDGVVKDFGSMQI